VAFDGSDETSRCDPSVFTRRDVKKYWRRLNGDERKSKSDNEIVSGESGIRNGRPKAVVFV
jgi:hypothetical protein